MIFNLKPATAILPLLCCVFAFAEPPAGKNWKLVYEDDFNYETEKLAERWVIMHEPQRQMLCGRWRENAVIENGVLRLLNKKESRAGQDWTSASLWTKSRFKYGYFEARYRYAKSSGVNNAFWVATYKTPIPENLSRFEIDVNEGHWPDKVNTNVHNWSDVWHDQSGKKRHRGWSGGFKLGKTQGSPGVSHNLDAALPMEKIRISSGVPRFFHLREVMLYGQSADGKYPDPMKPLAAQPEFSALENLARGAAVKASGVYYKSKSAVAENAVDGNINTAWSAPGSGEKFIEIDLGGEKSVACVQFVSGWNNKGAWQGFIADYKIEYFSGGAWRTLVEAREDVPEIDLSADFHTYALEWNENEMVFYFDGKPVRRFEHDFAHWQAPVLLSAAIVEWAGSVTDKVDGTSMDVDYVKVWQEEGREFVEEDYTKLQE